MASTPESVKNVMSGKAIPISFSGMNITKNHIDRFYSSFDEMQKGCWKWNAAIRKNGYGTIKANNKQLRAHRFSWIIHRGAIPEGLYILHKCDNPPCVNPDHLFLGTANDNLKDCMAKGRFRVASGKKHGSKTHPERWATGERHGTKTHPERITKGSKIGWSKLTEELIPKIRKEYRFGENGTYKLARKYGVSQTAIACVVKGKTWKHVKWQKTTGI